MKAKRRLFRPVYGPARNISGLGGAGHVSDPRTGRHRTFPAMGLGSWVAMGLGS